MEREELKGKQSNGDWITRHADAYDSAVDVQDPRGMSVAYCSISAQFGVTRDVIDMDAMRANATLIAEAGTVANRTGMWPLDMEQRIKALEEFVSRVAYDPIGPATASAESILNTLVQEARAILNKRNQP